MIDSRSFAKFSLFLVGSWVVIIAMIFVLLQIFLMIFILGWMLFINVSIGVGSSVILTVNRRVCRAFRGQRLKNRENFSLFLFFSKLDFFGIVVLFLFSLSLLAQIWEVDPGKGEIVW